MSTKLWFFGLIVAGAILEVMGDVVLKYWSSNSRLGLLIGGLGIYFAGSVFWAYSLRYETLSRAIVVFTLVNLVIGVVLGLLVFKEALTARQALGVGLALVAILLLEL